MTCQLGWRVVVVAIGVGLFGCDQQGPAASGKTATSQVTFDLQALYHVEQDGVQQTCASTLETVRLRADMAGGGRQEYQAEVGSAAYEEGGVAFDVEVEVGEVTFTAALVSNNGTVLYRGGQIEAIEADGFRIYLTELLPQTGVLLACPRVLSLPVNSDGYNGAFALFNRGIDPLTVMVVPPVGNCEGNQPCLVLEPTDFNLEAGESRAIFIYSRTALSPPVTVRLETPIGHADVEVQTSQ